MQSAMGAIPPSQATLVRNDRAPSLLWVHVGTATVQAARETHHLATGQGLWMPAGSTYTVEVGIDSVAFPIYPTTRRQTPALTTPRRIELPETWSDWLIYQFARSIGYLRGATSDTNLLDLATHPEDSRYEHAQAPAGQVPLPPMPRSYAAATVARSLIQRPGNPAQTADHARYVSVSVRTLQMQFLQETGLPFVRWRTAVRVAAGAALLDAGYEIGWAGTQVGFATAAGFTKAFRAHTGMTPRHYTKASPKAHLVRNRQDRDVTDWLLPQGASEMPWSDTPPPIPSTKTWSRINDFHVLVWVYKGSARVTVGGQTRRLRQGNVIWLPAGVRNSITMPRGALVLPLGSRHGTLPTRLPRNLVYRFDEADERYLLHTFVANYSLVRPRSHDPSRIAATFLERANRPRWERAPSPTETLPVHSIMRAVRNDPSDTRTLTQWAQSLDTDPHDLRAAFRLATGQTLSVWRYEVRMTEARRYLEEGLSVAQVASKLGYASPSTCSIMFTRAHGMSPRAYQQHGWQYTDEQLIVR